MIKRPGNVQKDRNRNWAFAADPSRYRILDAINNLETDWWTSGRSTIRPGDNAVIWQFLDHLDRRGIVALAEIVPGPEERSDESNLYWVDPKEGVTVKKRVEVRYLPLDEPLWFDGPQHDLVASLSVSRAHGGSVFKVTPEQWQSILTAAGQSFTQSVVSDVEEIKRRSDLAPTQKERLVQARLGQGKFRRDLLRYWDGCAVVGCKAGAVLRASHMKPWSKSTDVERLDAANGLLLTANLDALFNVGFITFSDQGYMLVSKQLSQQDRSVLQLDGRLRKPLTAEQKGYLTFHRGNIFVP
jgi:hypothetical protein